MTQEERKILVKMQVETHPFAGNFCLVALSFFEVPVVYIRNVPPSFVSTLGEVFQYSNWSTRVL